MRVHGSWARPAAPGRGGWGWRPRLGPGFEAPRSAGTAGGGPQPQRRVPACAPPCVRTDRDARGEPPLCAPQDSPWGGVRGGGALAPSRRGGTWAVGFPGLGPLTPSGRDGGEGRATCARKPRAERPPPRWRSRAPSAASAKAPCQASASPSVKPKRNRVLPPCGPRTGRTATAPPRRRRAVARCGPDSPAARRPCP